MPEPGFRLIIEDDQGERNVVPVTLGHVSIGRLQDNVVCLNERNVSRQHARIVRENGHIFAEDLDSYNGVFINGGRVQGRQRLARGDVIGIGDFRLELRGEELPLQADIGGDEVTPKPAREETTQPDFVMEETPAPKKHLPAAPKPRVPEPEERPEPTAIIRADQVQALETSRPQQIAGQQQASLICVSEHFPGRIFAITKTEMVMGRTEDNDICLPHRSVSRHHTKILCTGNEFKAVDLGSANGTFINGEEYAQLVLKPKDLVELGHVKLRFVPPGTPYEFTPEELVRQSTPTVSDSSDTTDTLKLSIRKRVGVGAVGAVLVMVAVGGWLAMRDPKGPDKEHTQVREVAAQKSQGDGETARLLEMARQSMRQRDWKQAQGLASALLSLSAHSEEAKEIDTRARYEQEVQRHFDAAVDAAGNGRWSEARREAAQVPEGSVYAGSAKPLAEQIESSLREAEAERKQEPARRAEPPLQAKAPQQKSPRPAFAPPAVESRPPPPPPAAPAPPPTHTDPKSFEREATLAALDNKIPKAIELFQSCVRADPKYARCYRGLGIAYNKQGDKERAVRSFRKYLEVAPDAPDRKQVEQLLGPLEK